MNAKVENYISELEEFVEHLKENIECGYYLEAEDNMQEIQETIIFLRRELREDV